MRKIGFLHRQNDWRFTAFALFTCLFVCGFSLMGQSKIGSKMDAPPRVKHHEKKTKETVLNLVMEVNDHEVSLVDRLDVKVSIVNVGSRVSYLLRDFYWGSGSLRLLILDNSGKPLPSEQIDDLLPPPPSENDPACMVRLNVGEFFGVMNSINVKGRFKTAGTYRLKAQYNCWLPEGVVTDKAITREGIFWKQPEPLVSKEVVIIVK